MGSPTGWPLGHKRPFKRFQAALNQKYRFFSNLKVDGGGTRQRTICMEFFLEQIRRMSTISLNNAIKYDEKNPEKCLFYS